MSFSERSDTRTDAPYWFGILGMVPGMYSSAIASVLMGFLLRNEGVAVNRISGVVAATALPYTWSFAIAPLIDLGGRRRYWVFTGFLLGACFLWPAIAREKSALFLRTLFLVAAGVCTLLGVAAIQSLMTEFPPALRGRVGGWSQAGNVGGGTLGGGLMLWLAQRLGPSTLATAVCVIFVLPTLAILAVQDSPRPASPGEYVRAKTRLKIWFAGVRQLVKSPRTWSGILFFAGPMGTSGAVFSAMGPDFHASANQVMWITGVGAGLIAVPGSLMGGWVADRIGKAWANIMGGLILAICAATMALAHLSPVSFGIGVLAYQWTIGFDYACYTALLLEVIGTKRGAAATRYNLLNSVGNFPTTYMTFFAGLAYKRVGPRGPMAFDAIANLAGAVALSAMLIWAARRKNAWDLTQPAR